MRRTRDLGHRRDRKMWRTCCNQGSARLVPLPIRGVPNRHSDHATHPRRAIGAEAHIGGTGPKSASMQSRILGDLSRARDRIGYPIKEDAASTMYLRALSSSAFFDRRARSPARTDPLGTGVGLPFVHHHDISAVRGSWRNGGEAGWPPANEHRGGDTQQGDPVLRGAQPRADRNDRCPSEHEQQKVLARGLLAGEVAAALIARR
jgi:hypothetical protein